MSEIAAKRPRGRPKVVLNLSMIRELAGEGMSNTQIMRALGLPSATWARKLREDGELRMLLTSARVSAKHDILAALKREALAGKSGAAREVLARIDAALP